ncbi:MAG TPA: phospho-N-acetylmuramoyl-pentapeptide-transferase [bacterium]|nr:phospho-N-acetylmuramoyl-pentapeptide-transferase [bacterium]
MTALPVLPAAGPAALAAAWIFAALVVIAGGRPLIAWLARSGAGKRVREDAPARHAGKAGTPTMGGLLIIAALLLAAGLTGAATGLLGPTRSATDLGVGLAIVAVFAAVGAIDDALGLARGRNLGLRAREKFALQIPAAFLLGVYVLRQPHLGGAVAIPGTAARWDLGWGYPVFCLVLVVGMVNAVNLTDGLDGLAAGTVAISAGALAAVAAWAGAGPAAVIAAATGGAALGFLWHNAYPAGIFMGDVGSIGLGAALAVAGVLSKREILMLLVAGVAVAEALSVMLQVGWFKMTGGRRLFRMSPIHHHFELSGWTEPQTVVRFWLCGALLAAAGIGLRP